MFKSFSALGRITAALAIMAMGSVASAVEGDLPTTGVNVGAYVTSLLTNLGTVIGLAIGAGFAIFALMLGVRFVKKLVRV